MTLLEKYRPRTLDDIYGHNNHVALFRTWIENNDIPHLLLYGPYGTGKTSIVEAMLKDYYGENYYNMNQQTKNASQQSVRGIGAMDEIIQKDLNIMPMGDFPFRVMVFEEAEQITDAGQRSLKRAIEEYAHNTRFIFITNKVGEMNEGVQERCVKLHFAIPDKEDIKALLMDIAYKEDMKMIHEIETEIDTIVSSKISPREAVKRFGIYLSGGSSASMSSLNDKCVLIVSRLFASRKQPVKVAKLYKGVMDIYESIRPDYSSPERDMLNYIFEEVYNNHFSKHPVIVGELSKTIAQMDKDIRESTNPNLHMASFLWKLSKAFGVSK